MRVRLGDLDPDHHRPGGDRRDGLARRDDRSRRDVGPKHLAVGRRKDGAFAAERGAGRALRARRVQCALGRPCGGDLLVEVSPWRRRPCRRGRGSGRAPPAPARPAPGPRRSARRRPAVWNPTCGSITRPMSWPRRTTSPALTLITASCPPRRALASAWSRLVIVAVTGLRSGMVCSCRVSRSA